MIGVDSHKRLSTVVVLNHRGEVLARRQFANTSDGFRELAAFSHRRRPRTWAIEGCNGVGKHVAQRCQRRPNASWTCPLDERRWCGCSPPQRPQE
jgi:hypothetical protein